MSRPAARRSVAELIAHYWEPEGEGHREALDEARELLGAGMTIEEIAADDMVGLPVDMLRTALGVSAPAVADPPSADERHGDDRGDDQRAAA